MKNIQSVFIDTNYILRLLIGDIPFQAEKSRNLFKEIEEEKINGIVSLLVINELIWILEHFYEKKRAEFIPQILKLVSLKKVKILETKKRDSVTVLEKMKSSNLDFTDLYLLYFSEKYKHDIATFDKEIVNQKRRRQPELKNSRNLL